MLDVAYVSSASSTRLHHLFNVALLFVLRRLENDLTKPLCTPCIVCQQSPDQRAVMGSLLI